jgi:predicted MFS family arabinose efflux permease
MADTEAAATKATNLRELGILIALGAVQFTSILDFILIMPLGPQLDRKLGVNPEQFSLIVSSYTIAAGIAGFVASSLVDRFSRKTAFLGLYIGFLVGTLFCGLATSYYQLVAARVVTGMFGGVLGGLAMAIVGDVFPDERRGRATGFLMSAFSMASIFGVPFGLFLGNHFDWHAPFLMLAALGLPILFLGMWCLPELKGHLNKSQVDQWQKMKETYTHPNHIRAFLLIVSMMLGTFMVVPFIAPYLVSNAGLTEGELPWVYFGGGVCSFVSSFFIGKWADKYGKLKVYRIVAPFSAMMMMILTTLPDVTMIVVVKAVTIKVGLLLAVAAVSMMMVSNSGRMIAAMAMINGSVENRLRGGFMSAYSSIQHISSGVGAYLAGKIVAESADGKLLNYGWVGVCGVSATLLSLWLAGRLRPAKQAPKPVAEPMEDLLENVTAAEAF